MSAPGPEVDPSTLEGGLNADRGMDVIACSVVFIVLCTAFLVLRFVASHVGRRAIFLEDWLMIPAWVLMMGLAANAIWSVKQGGVGRHEAWVMKNQPTAMVAWAQALFITEFMYGILIPLEKTTLLLLYLRIFSIHRWFRWTTYGMIAYIWAWGISESIVAVAQCAPVEFQWNKQIEGTCIDQLAYYRWVSVPNVIHDVFMLIVVAPVVWQLKIELRKKIALCSIFIIGSVGCVASFIRMYYFFQLDALSDKTWASIQLMSWTVAEPGVILICACMPALWPLLRRLPFKSLATTTGRSNNTSGRYESKQRTLNNSAISSALRRDKDDFIPLNDVESTGESGGDKMSAPGHLHPGYAAAGFPGQDPTHYQASARSEAPRTGRAGDNRINVTTEVTIHPN